MSSDFILVVGYMCWVKELLYKGIIIVMVKWGNSVIRSRSFNEPMPLNCEFISVSLIFIVRT